MLIKSTPLIIPTFNNPTFTNHFVEQSLNVGFEIIHIYDNQSTYPPMLKLLKNLEKTCNVIRLTKNEGPHYILKNPEVYQLLPEIFCLSDPDVEYSKSLPKDFLEDLLALSNRQQIGKVGFAMEVPRQEEFINPYMRLDDELWKMEDWEKQFWKNQVDIIKDNEVYLATLDTHFALYNKKFFDPMDRYKALRVAGSFTSKHLGLYRETIVPEEEETYYRNSAKYSYLRGKIDSDKNPVIEITVHDYTKLVEAKESLDRNLTRITLERDFYVQELQRVYSSNSWKLLSIPRAIMKTMKKVLKINE
jgi:hypothetical protein